MWAPLTWKVANAVVSLLLLGLVAGCRVADAQGSKGKAQSAQTSSYAAGVLIIKFKPQAGQILEATLHAQESPTPTGLAWFDVLNTRYGVTTIEPLFPHQPDVEEIKRKYPERARRAPGGAPLPQLNYIYKLTLAPDADVLHAAADYGAQPDVEYAQPDYLATTQQGGVTLP